MTTIVFERSKSSKGFIATIIRGTEASANKLITKYVERKNILLLGIVVPQQINTTA